MKWISVKDKIPENRKDVLICLSDSTIIIGQAIGHMWSAYWQEGFDKVNPKDRKVTHWMELPEVPETYR